MTTRIKGTARIDIDYVVEDDVDDLEAEQLFNEFVQEASQGGFEYGYADYDQQHEFNIEDDDEDEEA